MRRLFFLRIIATVFFAAVPFKWWKRALDRFMLFFAAAILSENAVSKITAQGVAARNCSPRIIVSLTTIPSRIHTVYRTIHSLLSQRLRPDMVVLWLDKDAHSSESLPPVFRPLESRGLTIQYCTDIGPHTKLIPALAAFPDDIIITADDDCVYSPLLIRFLYGSYRSCPSAIHCIRARRIAIDANGKPQPYRTWKITRDPRPSFRHLLTGVRGVLYPPRSLDREVFNTQALTRLCPKADDVWFYCMALKNRTPVRIARCADLLSKIVAEPDETESSLRIYNVKEQGNDIQFAAVMTEYDLYRYLK
jgi:hypothetical protein